MGISSRPVGADNGETYGWPLREFKIRPGHYRFRQEPLRIFLFRRRAKRDSYQVKIHPMPHGRVGVIVWDPSDGIASLGDLPSYALNGDWVILEGKRPDGTTVFVE